MDEAENKQLVLKFGSDISNYYPNRGLKVYKPRDDALQHIVNFRDPARIVFDPGHYLFALGQRHVSVGEVRYASTNRQHQGISNVRVDLYPLDLVDQKTALFGMTRTGKSNTVKIIAKSIFELRYSDPQNGRIGQIIFDYNGEYANENIQDGRGGMNVAALKNVWRSDKKGRKEDIVTYGSVPREGDPDRRITKLNFYSDENLQTGKEIINTRLDEYTDKYITAFRSVALELPPDQRGSLWTRRSRHVVCYRALLAKAGYELPLSLRGGARISGLFGEELRNALAQAHNDAEGLCKQAATLLANATLGWDKLFEALRGVAHFISEKNTGYSQFNQAQMNDNEGEGWADQRLFNLLQVFRYQNGPALVSRGVEQHTATVEIDYTDSIYEDISKGRLVIVDQSAGSTEINKLAADRIMAKVFGASLSNFTAGKIPAKILVYIEEAHNLLPSSRETDMQDIWVRTAKEGAKLGIGLIYSTQEVSSIQKNILKNTANWFIGHLNSTEETKELNKFYDFADFERSILRAQDKGFVRVKTLSNSFVVPVQVDRFEVGHAV